MNYYHCFIKGYAKVTHPLYNQVSLDNATQKKMTVTWIEECKEAFDMLKALCTSTPVLALADFTKPFKLHMDASTAGLGVVLYQEQHENNQVKRHASRALSKSESHYPVHKVEFLVLKCPVTESLQKYLYGNIFALYSDKNPLTYVLTMAKLDTTRQWWLPSLPCSVSPFTTAQENLMSMQTHCPEFQGIRTLKWMLSGPFSRPQ